MYTNFKIQQLIWISIFTFLTADSFSDNNSVSNSFLFEFRVGSYLINNSSIRKTSVITAGMNCTFPVKTDHFYISFGTDYGHIKPVNLFRTEILLSNISLSYSFPLYKNTFFIAPSISLNNCALHLQPSGDLNDVAIIATWENEFGAGTGINFSLQLNRFNITLPILFLSIFSSDPAYCFFTGIKFGISLHSRQKNAL